MNEEKPKWAETLLIEISEMKSDVKKLKAEMQGTLQGLETRIGNTIENFERQVREWTTPDPDEWFLETFSILSGSFFVASLVASVPAHGWYKIGWGVNAAIFGLLFCGVRLEMGRRIHAPRLNLFLISIFLIVAVVISLITMAIGYLQLIGLIN